MGENTDWVIHWTRKQGERDYPQGKLPPLPFGTDPFEVLKNILKKGVLIPSRSYRKKSATINEPVVCVTDMPLSEFVIYANGRDKVARYAVAFRKEEFVQQGGRPVIYGNFYSDPLPPSVKYLTVNTGFTDSGFIDWTHEREWRWKGSDPDADLELWKFSEIAVIVENEEEVKKIEALKTELGIRQLNRIICVDNLKFNWHRRFDIHDNLTSGQAE